MSQNMPSGQASANATINQKIIAFEVVKDEVATPEQENVPSVQEDAASELTMERVHENLDRPERLLGSTYKIKTPVSPHALYITINDVLLNQDTEFEQRHPYEIFINSKNMDHFMWVVALTRVISAVFRKGGDVIFMVEELKAVFDPKGGYFKKGGRYMPSLVAEIGYAIEDHLQTIGLLDGDQLDEGQRELLAAKRAEYEQRSSVTDTTDAGDFPAGAQLCTKCNVKAAILMDGCYTCLNCAESKCG